MKGQRHYIARISFDLRMSAEEDAFELQKEVSKCFNDQIRRQMSELFDELIPADQFLFIDQVELELGRLSPSELDNGTLAQRILRSLREQIPTISRGTASQSLVHCSSLPAHAFEQWIEFIVSGMLPWPPHQHGTDWENLVLEALILNITLTEKLRKVLREAPVARQRLVLQYPDQFIVSLLEIYAGVTLQTLPNELRRIYEKWKSGNSESALIQHKKKDGTGSDWNRKIKDFPEFRRLFWDYFVGGVILQGERKTEAQLVEDISENVAEKFITEKDSRLTRPDIGETSSFLEKRALDEKEMPENAEEGNTSEWYIDNAGVILLHPFLVQFFERIGLLAHGKFMDEEASTQALHLIHYLATGHNEPMEYDLFLAKIICGIPQNWPVHRQVSLPEEWLLEADHLLEVVVKKWEVLGEVSAHSLREGFLLRSGKLSEKKGKWLLQVEQGAIDVLLDRLPWGISLVKLPWMKEILTVEWR